VGLCQHKKKGSMKEGLRYKKINIIDDKVSINRRAIERNILR
jgi:hypothetical protein